MSLIPFQSKRNQLTPKTEGVFRTVISILYSSMETGFLSNMIKSIIISKLFIPHQYLSFSADHFPIYTYVKYVDTPPRIYEAEATLAEIDNKQ